MRRLLLAALLAAAFVSPVGASASSVHAVATAGHTTPQKWHPYSSKSFKFAFSYPAGWQLTATYSKLVKQVWLLYTGIHAYSMQASILPMKPAANVGDTLKRFVSMEKGSGNTAIGRIKWSSTTLGGVPAMVGVAKPNTATEGGQTVSAALYITQWQGRMYEIVMQANHRPPLTKLSQFPPLYLQILKTWKFLG